MSELRECFDCHWTWQPGVSTAGGTLPRCPVCQSFNVESYDEDAGLRVD